MKKTDFFPIILGSDENAYGNARLFNEAYGIKPILACAGRLIPTCHSKLFELRVTRGFDRDEIFVPSLLSIIRELKERYEKVIVLPCSDYYTALMVRNHHHFKGLIENSFVSKELLDTFDTKDKFYALCEKYGMDYPRTVVAESDKREEAILDLPFDFPIVVKPENSNASEYLHASFEGKKKVYFINSKEEYLTLIRNMSRCDYKGKLIIQEFIPGGDEAMRVVNSYSGEDGVVRAISVGQPILEEYAPATIGNYAAIISRHDTVLAKRVKDFLEQIGYVGFCNIDMKYDAAKNRYVMFEINPRLGRSSYYVRGAGINMMRMLVEDCIYKQKADTAIASESSLWSNVPVSVIGKYLKDTALKKEAFSLIRKGKFSRTLDCSKDNDIRRFIRIKRYYHGQSKNFKKYFFDKG